MQTCNSAKVAKKFLAISVASASHLSIFNGTGKPIYQFQFLRNERFPSEYSLGIRNKVKLQAIQITKVSKEQSRQACPICTNIYYCKFTI